MAYKNTKTNRRHIKELQRNPDNWRNNKIKRWRKEHSKMLLTYIVQLK